MSMFRMRIVTRAGVIADTVRDADDRTTVAQHANAIARFLATGDVDPLHPFADRSVQGHQLLTDPDELEAWAAQGELEFEDIYHATDR